ncbi:hypothetical protein FRB96_009246 [Tulasnella sp. 330]|nr:hypothetical protein FRB96_009246 [Tulasnella sp. 330]
MDVDSNCESDYGLKGGAGAVVTQTKITNRIDEGREPCEDEEPLFIVDAMPSVSATETDPTYVYDCDQNNWMYPIGEDSAALGEVDDDWQLGTCFNCDSLLHQLTTCPLPRDRFRIEANKRRWAEMRDENSASAGTERFFERPMWVEQRLRWVDEFQPGRIKGPGLREAIGLPSLVATDLDENLSKDKDVEMPWYDGGNAEGSGGGMMFWGYPPGWTGTEDPVELMRARIMRPSEDSLGMEAEPVTLELHGDEDKTTSPEVILLNSINATTHPLLQYVVSPDKLSPSTDAILKAKRWAYYHTTLFSSDLLTISNVSCPLPPPPPSQPQPSPSPAASSSTFTQDRRNLWAALINKSPAGDAALPSIASSRIPASNLPWRLPDAFDFRKGRQIAKS